jgi:hypothetical protein
MKSAFEWLARGYIDRGFSVMPELPRSKIPGVGGRYLEGWQRFCREQADEAQIAAWIEAAEPDAGISLACGFAGVVALDVDNPKAYGAVREVFGSLRPPSKVGQKGVTGFFCAKGELIASRKFLERRDECGRQFPLVEILSTGNKTTLPPSIHPETLRPYQWRNASLEEVRHPRDLPVLTRQHLADLETALAPLMEPKRPITLRPATTPALPETDFEKRRYIASARTALDREAQSLALTCKPGRNRRLFEVACKLGKWIHNGILASDALIAALSNACNYNGLTAENGSRDVMQTIQRGLNISRGDPLPELRERRRA